MTLHEKLYDKKDEISLVARLYNENRKTRREYAGTTKGLCDLLDEIAGDLIYIQGRLIQEHDHIVKAIMKDE